VKAEPFREEHPKGEEFRKDASLSATGGKFGVVREDHPSISLPIDAIEQAECDGLASPQRAVPVMNE
jgi:hypothetical protein